MAANGERLCLPYNAEELIDSLIMRLNEWSDLAAAAGGPVTKIQIIHIAYWLIAKTSQ